MTNTHVLIAYGPKRVTGITKPVILAQVHMELPKLARQQVHVAAAECAQRASVNKRGQLLYQEYLTRGRLHLKDRDLLHGTLRHTATRRRA